MFTDRCPKFERLQNFDADRYLGTWYQAYRDRRDPFQTGECGCTKYTASADGTIKIESTEWRLSQKAKDIGLDFGQLGDKFTELTSKMTNFGRARKVPSPNSEAIFKIQFNPLTPEATYEVIETDYKQFTIVYSCTMLVGNLFKAEYAYILTREPLETNDVRLRVIEERARYALKKRIPSFD